MPVRKVVNVPLSTDKGMCGGVNSQISKLALACTKVDLEGMDPASMGGMNTFVYPF
jgi:F0F1-type ATP synthase gamma subunit